MDKNSKKAFQKALNDKSAAYISSDALPISFQTKILKIEDDHLVLKNTVTPEYISRVMEGKNFFFQVSMVRYQASKMMTDGSNIIYPLSDSSLIKDERQAERFSFTAEEKVICEILNPHDLETRISKPVLDMSAYGLSFRTTFDSKLIVPGTSLKEIRVLIDGEPYKSTSGKIIYQRRLMNMQGQIRIQVGIKFDNEV